MSPKLAYIYEPNTTSSINGLLFFEINHIDHEVLKTVALDGLWVEYHGINEIEFSMKDNLKESINESIYITTNTNNPTGKYFITNNIFNKLILYS